MASRAVKVRRGRRPGAPAAPSGPVPPPGDGWWGSGPPPAERWPATTLNLEGLWRQSEEGKVGPAWRWESPDGRYWFDADAADRAVEFFPTFLTHHKGEFADQPFTLLPYQELLIVRPLFGWKRVTDGLRRFRKVFLAVPKGNGKSPLGAGIGLYLTFCDGDDGAEVYSAAADKDQAAIVFDTAKIMVENSEDLTELSQVLKKTIEVASTHSYYRVLSADAKTKHGFNIHGLIFDEFHAQPSRELYETLYRGTVKRRQPIVAMITTAGDDDESICAEEWDYAAKVRSGSFADETYLPVIFEADKDDDWKARETWTRVNPGFGVTVKADAIESECTAAQLEPRKLNDFLRFHLNRWVNQATAWMPIDWWDACRGDVDIEALAQLPVYAGLDMSQKYDLTALVLVFPIPLDGPPQAVEVVAENDGGDLVKRTISLNFRIVVLPYFWIPADTMRKREQQDRVPYAQWEAAGLVRATEGNVIDYDRILRDIRTEIAPRFPRLKAGQIAYDPAFATDIALRLQAAGFSIVEVLQNYRHLSEPSHVLEALVQGGRVTHDGNRVLRWNFENVAVRQDDAGRIRPVKPKRQAKRIDGVVATIMALSRVIVNPVRTSVYDSRGVLTL